MKHKVVYNACYGGFSLSDKAWEWLKENHGIERTHEMEWDFEQNRHDERLVACVEALDEEANGQCADLRIEEIEGNLYNIREYDGDETVITPAQYRWIEIPE